MVSLRSMVVRGALLPGEPAVTSAVKLESILLRTRRLHLRSATPELAAADLNDRPEFCRLLDADLPAEWPPPLNDINSQTYTLEYLQQNPDAAGWMAWYFLLPGEFGERREVIGIGGFTGKPSPEGIVEIGYSIMPIHQGLGFASEAVAALVDWAFTHPEVRLVIAQTFPSLIASIRVLENNDFQLLGQGSEPGTIRFGRARAAALK